MESGIREIGMNRLRCRGEKEGRREHPSRKQSLRAQRGVNSFTIFPSDPNGPPFSGECPAGQLCFASSQRAGMGSGL